MNAVRYIGRFATMNQFIYRIDNSEFVFGGVNSSTIVINEAIERLTVEELNLYHSFLYDKKSKDFLTSRYIAKGVLGTLLSCPFENIHIQKGIFGQPYIAAPVPHNLRISISHTEQYSFALSHSEAFPIGIDFEAIDVNHQNAILSQLTYSDKRLIDLHHNHFTEVEVLTLIWSLKESISKALLTGMLTPFGLFEVSTLEMKGDIGLATFKQFPQFIGMFQLFDGYVFSLVLPKKIQLQNNYDLIFGQLGTILP